MGREYLLRQVASFCSAVDTHAMFAAKFGHRHAASALAQDRKDLRLVKPRHLHENLLWHLAEEILRSHPISFGEGYRGTGQARLSALGNDQAK
ncbi:MAG: hypothetical protein WBB85_11375 [Albidovulum sp.]|uniref:hypothetical protein n=1 Tax=Albidovulum sp. TaxID=1872424 RepID=UPI003CA27A29